MPRTVELAGRAAAPGIASGPLVWLDRPRPDSRRAGDPASERAALLAAIAQALAELSALAGQASGDAGDILAFQIAMLEDDNLADPVLAAIEGGVPADEAWMGALKEHLAEYRSAEDEYFRARAADVKDVHDRVLRHLLGGADARPGPGAILAGDDLSPSFFLETDWRSGGGIALTQGSSTSHVAILARARGVPMVVGIGSVDRDGHAEAIVDGTRGRVILSPGPAEREHWERERRSEAAEHELALRHLHRPALSADGKRVRVLVNVAGPADLEHIEAETCDGIGLMRTEFLFRDGEAFPDEETQYRAYRRLLEWAGPRPVTIRTLDVGGDKPIRGLTVEGESNTFLGVRGIRLSFRRPEVFRVQLKALARAAVHGTLKVMWPMVTVPEELDRARTMFDEELAALQAQGVAAARPPLGMMIEVPAAAIVPDRFAAAEFFSIGSNDLIQYVAAAARDNGAVASLGDGALPAVLKLIEGLAEFGRRRDIEVSICGDLASEPRHIPALLAAGLSTLSVAPAALGQVKTAIASAHVGPTA